MGYPLSGRGRVRAEAPGVSSSAFIVRLRRLWAGRFLLAFLAILGSSPVLAQMQVYYVHSDHLNTPRWVTDEHNTVLWQNPPLSEPFGLMPPEEDPDGDGRRFILNLRFPGQYFDTESSTHYNFFRDYDPLSGRYLQSDPIGLDGGINTYAYVEGNPLSWIDPLSLATNVTIWQPVGWGKSSFGHVSTDINGTTYSFGPSGMSVMPTSNYVAKNGFRNGMAVGIDLTHQQEATLEECMLKSQDNYSVWGNNCGSPIQNCLKQVGIDTSNQTLPVSLGNRLLDIGIINGITEYPASHPSSRWRSAPWTR